MTSPDFFLETEGVFPDYISEIHNIFPDQLVLQMMRVTDPSFKTKKLSIFFQFGQKSRFSAQLEQKYHKMCNVYSWLLCTKEFIHMDDKNSRLFPDFLQVSIKFPDFS